MAKTGRFLFLGPSSFSGIFEKMSKIGSEGPRSRGVDQLGSGRRKHFVFVLVLQGRMRSLVRAGRTGSGGRSVVWCGGNKRMKKLRIENTALTKKLEQPFKRNYTEYIQASQPIADLEPILPTKTRSKG